MQLAQCLGKHSVGIVGGVLSGPPYVVPKLAAFPEAAEFLLENLQTDEAVDRDLVASPSHRC